MQRLGHKVILRSPTGTRAGGQTSDLVVKGKAYDVYTQTTTSIDRIVSAIARKNSQCSGIVLDLSRTSVKPSDLNKLLIRVRNTGATNTLVFILCQNDDLCQKLNVFAAM